MDDSAKELFDRLANIPESLSVSHEVSLQEPAPPKMMNGYAKGPWDFDIKGDYDNIYIYARSDAMAFYNDNGNNKVPLIAEVTADHNDIGLNVLANAKLISAAPEMLKILRRVQRLCKKQKRTIDGLDKVIQKASGGLYARGLRDYMRGVK